jgi:squalene-hopene/tetraprenyl-beta-curcumene cyclase
MLGFGGLRPESTKMSRLPFIVLVFLAFATLTSAQATTAAAGGWNREAAAAYLDHRMDEWFAKGEQLRTGEGRTTCVSCHTVIPYALARPALRRAMNGSLSTAPTLQEARLVDETSRRVQTYDTHQLLYDFDEDKKGESRGTEAVLYALILASADAGQGRRESSDATRRAMSRLWQTQRADGAWEWLDFGLEPFESIDSPYQGAAFAALAVGLTPALSSEPGARAGIAKLREYLQIKYPTQNLHNRIWGMLAFASLDQATSASRARPDRRDALLDELARRQRGDGGWSLAGLGEWRWNRATSPFQSPGTRDVSLTANSDGYATGLIIYSLRRAGLPVDHPVIKKGLQWLGANQLPVRVGDQEWPAWRAHSLNFDREHGGSRGEPWRRLFMSDAATAFASLALSVSD